jgi:hypothetical protein
VARTIAAPTAMDIAIRSQPARRVFGFPIMEEPEHDSNYDARFGECLPAETQPQR